MYMIINERCSCPMHIIQSVVIVCLYVAYSVVVVQKNSLSASIFSGVTYHRYTGRRTKGHCIRSTGHEQ